MRHTSMASPQGELCGEEEGRALAEGFPTVTTSKELLPGENLLMLRKSATLTTCVPTLITPEVLLYNMDSLVLNKGVALLKGSTTLTACKGFLSSVN